MRKLWVALMLSLCTVCAQADGLGISSKIYADRFNTLAQKMQATARLRSEGAKVTRGAKAMSVSMKLDRFSSLVLAYGTDRSKLEGVMLFQELGGDEMRSLDAVTNMILTSMAAFEDPKKLGVADMTVAVCRGAMKEAGKDFKQTVMGVGISCTLLANGVLMLSVS